MTKKVIRILSPAQIHRAPAVPAPIMIDKTPYKLLLYGPTDFFAGPFLICGDGGEDLISLTDSQITKYEKKHHSPLIFLELYPKPITLKCTPELYAKCMGEEHQHDTQENERDER